jgi:hypothetical protein
VRFSGLNLIRYGGVKMKNPVRILIVIVVLSLTFNAGAQVSPPLLEQYNFEMGTSGAVELYFLDQNIHPGTAQFRFELRKCQNDHDLRIEVFRHVNPEQVFFALLLERIEITFYNSSNTPIRRIVLDESLGDQGLFIIGDSNDGYFRAQRSLKGLSAARRVTISLFGNYE